MKKTGLGNRAADFAFKGYTFADYQNSVFFNSSWASTLIQAKAAVSSTL